MVPPKLSALGSREQGITATITAEDYSLIPGSDKERQALRTPICLRTQDEPGDRLAEQHMCRALHIKACL